jgi:hypothetical protein
METAAFSHPFQKTRAEIHSQTCLASEIMSKDDEIIIAARLVEHKC